MEVKDVRFGHKILKRTRAIFYQGDKYHRRCNWHGQRVYIVCFLGVNKCQIELANGDQKIVVVDDEKFELKEYSI